MTDVYKIRQQRGLIWGGSGFVATILNAASHYISFVTGPLGGQLENSSFNFGNATFRLALFEDEASTLGTVVDLENSNSNSLRSPPALSLVDGVTPDNAPLLPDSGKWRDASIGGDEISGDPGSSVLVLKPNTAYILQIQNTSGGNVSVKWNLAFSEG